MDHLIEMDGSLLEGGGQLIRNSVALSSLLMIPIKITNVRGGRKQPGLKAQHLTGLTLIQQMTPSSVLLGAEMNSKSFTFIPERRETSSSFKTFIADTRTAGAICLLAQVALPRALFLNHPSLLELRGGTDALMAPTAEYYQRVFLPNLRKFLPSPSLSAFIEMNVLKKGYFPKGGGLIEFNVNPVTGPLQPLIMEHRGDVESITILASVSGSLSVRIAQEMSAAASRKLRQSLPETVKIQNESYREENSKTNGSSITIIAKTTAGCVLGGSAIGSSKIKPTQTGISAADDLLTSLVNSPSACVDVYVQDQLIIYMALADGVSRIRTCPVSLHTKTGIYIVEKLTDCKFNVTEECIDDKLSSIIECKGIGYFNGLITR